MKEVWVANISESSSEIWNCIELETDSKEEIIKEGMLLAKDEELDFFGIGRKVPIVEPTIDAEEIIERISDRTYDEFGEIAEGYLQNIKAEHLEELDLELQKVFNSWIKKYRYSLNSFLIEDEEEIKVIK